MKAIQTIKTQLLINGGSASGVCAAIQAAQYNIDVIIVEEGPWLGGMLSAAGVSCIDGNHNMPAGLWGEFRQKLYDYYGGPKQVESGWVSNTNFEPHIANQIFHNMLSQFPNIHIYKRWTYLATKRSDRTIHSVKYQNKANEILSIVPEIIIEATDFADLAADSGCRYDLGIDKNPEIQLTGLSIHHSPMIQDLTWVAILEDFGSNHDKRIQKPEGYDPNLFTGCCKEYSTPEHPSDLPAEKFITYGKLPNNKYMLNWPIRGNDFFADYFSCTPLQRKDLWAKAKDFTNCMVYFIQHELGLKNLGLSQTEFPTKDHLALSPYIRESRRFYGYSRLTLNHLLNPYDDLLYQQGIAVGDYPIDHHHNRNPNSVKEKFPPIPSFNIPYGSLIPLDIDNLLIVEKSISVTHIVNGTTRLQPIVMQLGQAAGIAAALAITQKNQPSKLNIRQVQQEILQANGYIMPFFDMPNGNKDFIAIHEIGASGLMRGTGQPHKWANRTYFYPDQSITRKDFQHIFDGLSISQTVHNNISKNLETLRGQTNLDRTDSEIKTRRDLAVYLHQAIKPFEKPLYL